MEQKTKTVMIVFAILIGALLLYGIINKPKAIIVDDDDNSEDEPKKFNIWIILIIGALIVIGWLYYKGSDSAATIPTMTPDEFDEILKERLVKKEGLKGFYDRDGKLQYAPGAVVSNDQRPFVPAGTGQEYMVKEITIKDPDSFHEPQSRVILANLNRDKKLLQGGLFTFHEHTTMFEWLKEKSFLKKLPLASPESEGLQLAQFASEQEIDIGDLQRMRGITRQPSYGFEERGYEQPYGYESPEEPYEEESQQEPQSSGFFSKFTRRKQSKYRKRR